MSTMRLAARYVALYVFCLCVRFDGHLTVTSFLMAQSYSGFICFLAWTSNIFARSPSKRAVALAFINAFSQLGNFAGSCVVCYRTFAAAFGIDFIRTGIHGKSPGVRLTHIRTRFVFRQTCSALPCASSSSRYSPERTKICRSASPREAEGTGIYFKKYQYSRRDHHLSTAFQCRWLQLRYSVDTTQDSHTRPRKIRLGSEKTSKPWKPWKRS